MQHEVLPRTSVEVGFFHREFYGFAVTDNLAVSPSDFIAVLDHRAAGPAPARRRRLSGRHAVRPERAVAVRRHPQLHHLCRPLRRRVPEVQRHRRHRQRAARATASRSRAASPAATRRPTTARSGRRCRRSRCSIRTATSRPASCRSTRASRPTSCRRSTCSVSGTFTSKPGIQVSGFGTPVAGGAFAANYTVVERRRAPILGRPLAGSAPNITVNLIEPHSILGARVNELNMRVGKILRFGRKPRQRRRGLLQPAERGDAAQLQPGVHPGRRVAARRRRCCRRGSPSSVVQLDF